MFRSAKELNNRLLDAWYNNPKKANLFIIVLFLLTVLSFGSPWYSWWETEVYLIHRPIVLYKYIPSWEPLHDIIWTKLHDVLWVIIKWHHNYIIRILFCLKVLAAIIVILIVLGLIVILWGGRHWLATRFIWCVSFTTILQGLILILFFVLKIDTVTKLVVYTIWWGVFYVWLFVDEELKYNGLYRYVIAICASIISSLLWYLFPVFPHRSYRMIVNYCSSVFIYRIIRRWFQNRLDKEN